MVTRQCHLFCAVVSGYVRKLIKLKQAYTNNASKTLCIKSATLFKLYGNFLLNN